ncbi:ferroxidase FET5 Ecym_1526 [Eremothecium cymbalariae DBVPG|uniref:Uncharacterized protein n=1 Tax=Eremothecium cymbalariae (strain CBS 270.75 / DBVPG 7215 / KCTC 17166 / NRRL Y-17582) TaxID=931890 RepID=G8JMT2_ERECY|nr:hypothetical protein Ecym_1526 [Eremothecium cymbalariae DBVPG\
MFPTVVKWVSYWIQRTIYIFEVSRNPWRFQLIFRNNNSTVRLIEVMNSLYILASILLFLRASRVVAETHTFHFKTGWTTVNPDGMHEKRMITFNGQWPLPEIHVKKGDRVEIYLNNGFENLTTSLHFHGLFHNTSEGNQVQMDGPQMATQCPIMPGATYLYNFTVPNQVGTFWYHSHTGAQYADGMRGAFIIHDDDAPFDYDEELTLFVSDIYYKPYYQLAKEFLSRYNPTGAEPVPQNLLFNHTTNATVYFEPNKTYLLRIINGAFFVSQYLYIEDHEFTVVEIDGVYVKPNTTDLLYLASGQRTSVLVKSKNSTDRNYAFMQKFDHTMLDVIPPELQLNRVNQLCYNKEKPPAAEYLIEDLSKALNDFYLTPYYPQELYRDYEYQIILNLSMVNLADGVNYALFNNISFVAPNVPTLTTVLTAGELAKTPFIYGNINPFVLEYDEVVEVVINNFDDGAHPFHLHGHNFQIVQKSPSFINHKTPVPYNESNPLSPFPEFPAIRDTVVLQPNGHIVLRFKANNPGTWIFHCHVNWHLEQGLAAMFIEAPLQLQAIESLSDNYKELCAAANIPLSGNAAGHSDDWFNMDGLKTQPKPLPSGFTAKGYFAFFLTTIVGLFGLYTVTKFGLHESIQDDVELHAKLSALLEK